MRAIGAQYDVFIWLAMSKVEKRANFGADICVSDSQVEGNCLARQLRDY